MSKSFLDDNFLLESKASEKLYHEYAAKMPIFDYHCHLPVKQIAEDKIFDNITQVWLYGDHYKWRSMRTNGINERFCTGNATDKEKFEKWAETVPYTVGNPHYHWTHLELKRYFDVSGKVLNSETADEIYNHCSDKINSKEFSVRNLLRKMNVKALCTTDDPIDSLSYHKQLKGDFEIKILPTFRPDKAMAGEDAKDYNQYLDLLSEASNINISSYSDLILAVQKRHDFFAENNCLISDHGIETAYAESFTQNEINEIFNRIRSGSELNQEELLKLKSALLIEFGKMDHEKGWVQQFHLGALRNNNTRLFNKLGADTGFDSILDIEIAKPLSKFLDSLDKDNKLAKTILYNLNPRDNELMATMIGNFQDGSIPGKMQFGTGWWFLDQKTGMETQIRALANLGLLSRFVGMLTDSRSFLSFPRHEYFRRILCNLLGSDIESGQLPTDYNLIGKMVENICFNNINDYIGLNLK